MAQVPATNHPLSGLYQPRPMLALHYGPNCVQTHLLSLLPSKNSRAFIVTGNSLASKTPLVENVEKLLGSHHAGTFADIKQHAPVKQLDEATEKVQKDKDVDTIISIGGGSPIDSAKAISHRHHENTGRFLHHITIPTTLSVAEATNLAGYTTEDGTKTSVKGPGLAVAAILYDSGFARYTPVKLWTATGFRALDHAVESMYHPSATEVPCRAMCLFAVKELFDLLPRAKETHGKEGEEAEDVCMRLMLAAYAALGFLGQNMIGGLGLSHALGYALGSPYSIPHGETSAMTLGHVVKLKAMGSKNDAEQLARLLPMVGGKSSGEAEKDAIEVGDRILQLVKDMGLHETLSERGVGKDQVDIITQRATGAKEGELFDKVKVLVEGLY